MKVYCHECNGETFTLKTVQVVTGVGPYNVVDGSARRPVCDSCGEYSISSNLLEKIELRAALVVYSDAAEITGGVLRFARKALSLTQAQLAEKLGTTAESISRWERDERPMEKWLHPAVKGLILDRLNPHPKDVTLQRAG